MIVGAGLSGIGVARRLSRELPDVSYVVLEARSATGGTWDLFRYPGVRSDSDMYTLGYVDRPWRERSSMPAGSAILRYVREAAAERGVDRHIRLDSRVRSIAWSSAQARWTVEGIGGGTPGALSTDGEPFRIRARWVFAAGGYYRPEAGYTPTIPGRDRFAGEVVHPQQWPEGLDPTGRRVVVIGSGATAVTLAPALAERAALVTVVQRTPTYVLPAPQVDRLALRLSRLLGPDRGYAATRRIKIDTQAAMWRFCRRYPRTARRLIRRITMARLPPGYDVDTHFRPPYDPWDQRLCAAPGGDLFRAITAGSVAMITDTVAGFTAGGLELGSGREVLADLVVTATGLVLQPFGGFEITVDGEPVRLAEHVAYKGFMLDGVPNFGYAIGYPNASWTLKVDLVAEHFCRLLAELRDRGATGCVPVRPTTPMIMRPALELGSGYVRRSADSLPRQGDRDPWRTATGYRDDVILLRRRPLLGDGLRVLDPVVPAQPDVGEPVRRVEAP